MIPRIAWLLGTRRLAIGLWRAWFCLATTLALAELMALPAQAGSITLQTRWRTGSTNLADATAHAGTVTWEASKTAVVVCDMWDQHHCPDATERVGEMAPAMNEVLLAARARGMLILHCPSDTLKFYQDHPGRKLAQSAPPVTTDIPLQGWCSRMADREAPLPIDDSDNFCQWMLESFVHKGATVMMAPASGFYATPGLGKDEVRLAKEALGLNPDATFDVPHVVTQLWADVKRRNAKIYEGWQKDVTVYAAAHADLAASLRTAWDGGLPPTVTVPDLAASKSPISRSAVDLPQPEGPSRHTNSPRSTLKLRSS